MSRQMVIILCTGFLLATMAIWWKIGVPFYLTGNSPLPDFDAYYRLVGEARSGQNPYQVDFMTTAGPPLVLLAWLPFNWLPLTLARASFVFISLISGALACWLLARRLRPLQAGRLALLMQLLLWLSFPARFALAMGQWGLVMTLLVVMLLSGSAKVQGLALALLTTLKTLFATALLVLLSRKTSWKIAIGCLLVLLTMSLWLTPLAVYQDYLTNKGTNYFSQTLRLEQTDYYNQSLKSSLARLELGWSYPLGILVLLFWLGKTAWTRQDVGLAVLLSLIISPLLWQHYLVLVWPLWWRLMFKAKPRQYVGMLMIALCLFIDLPFLHQLPLNILSGLLASHQFWGLLGLTFLWKSAFSKPLIMS